MEDLQTLEEPWRKQPRDDGGEDAMLGIANCHQRISPLDVSGHISHSLRLPSQCLLKYRGLGSPW